MLNRQLPILVDIIKEGCPTVRKITSMHMVCDPMNSNKVYKSVASEVHKLFRLYFTIPITSSTGERTFSVLKRILTYLRSTMTEKRLNNCMFLHVHKDLTDEIDNVMVVMDCICIYILWLFIYLCMYVMVIHIVWLL